MEDEGKIGLSVVETGWLLQRTEAQVRRMLKRGELSYAVDGRLVAIDDVERLLETALATICLRWLRFGLIEAPRPQERWGLPASLFVAFDQLLLASGTPVYDDTAHRQPILLPVAGDGGVVLDRTKCSLWPGDSFPSDLENSINSTSSLLCVP